MAQDPVPTALSPEIGRLLHRLRWRIRAYVWLEGLAVALVWLGATFWVGLGLDYLPVLIGADEMPRLARLILLGAIAAVMAWILYRWIARRAFVRLSSSSMAVLLERQFPEFRDSLVTAVELSGRTGDIPPRSQEMLAHAAADAQSHLDLVQLRRVFNFVPLARMAGLAAVSVLSVVLLGLLARDALALWASRLYLLSDTPWPRRAHIELLGFHEQQTKVAKGGNLILQVRAVATRRTPPPEVCTIHYRTADGDQGRVNMSRDGEPREGYQHYVFEGKPFKDILSSVDFDVVGYDHRLRNYRVEVVDSPTLVDVQLDCELPAYTGLLPRTEQWQLGTQLPRGTRIKLWAQANKELRGVEVVDPEAARTTRLDGSGLEPGGHSFRYDIPFLDRPLTLDVTLHDVDGISSQTPYRLTIGALEDQPPQVAVSLRGIGTAITPDARLPAVGEITDDYGTARAWVELQLSDTVSRQFPLTLGPGGKVQEALDLRAQRARSDEPLQLAPDSQIVVTFQAQDHYNLKEGSQVGRGDAYALAVVRPEELLALLEARELGLRRRFEQMIDEMTESRDSLIRVRSSYESPDARPGADPEDAPEGGTSDEPAGADDGSAAIDPAADLQRARSLRLLRVQRAVQQGQRAAQEVLGVAVSFDEIREELINNRVDAQDRQVRLKEQIADPLRALANDQFPELEQILRTLEAGIDAPQGPAQAAQAVEQADQILVAMDQVLQKMLDLESYNELVDLIRALIREQEELLDRTQQQRKKQALELLK